MQKKDRIFIAGHRGLVGSALVRALQASGFENLVLRTRGELELADASAVRAFFAELQPRHVFLAAAKVGGIVANATYPADFISENLAIELNVIRSAREHGVDRLLFLASGCIYPRHAPQPMPEICLLSGPLEPTNRAYALAKIAGIELCRSFNAQYGTRYLAVMPANLYGPGDNYDLTTSHVIPALIRKFHEAKRDGAPRVTVWGTGTPRREFLHSDDLAQACLFLMRLPRDRFAALCTGEEPPLINVGYGEDITIRELAEMIRVLTGYAGDLVFDHSRPDGAPRKLLDSTKLRNLGWRPKIPLKEGIARTLEAPMAAEDSFRAGALH